MLLCTMNVRKNKKTVYSIKDVENSQIHDGIVFEFFHKKISKHFTKLISSTTLTPNNITIISFLLLIPAALGFITGEFLWVLIGAIIINLSYIFDSVDGEIARLKNMKSLKGAMIDSVTDRIGDVIIYMSISFGLYIRFNNPLFLIIGSIVIATVFMINYPWDRFYLIKKTELNSTKMKSILEKILPKNIKIHQENMRFTTDSQFFLILLGSIFFPFTEGFFNSMTIALLLIIVIGTVYWIIMLFSALKYLETEDNKSKNFQIRNR